MNAPRRIAVNTIFQIASQVFNLVLSFVFTLYLTRLLGPTDFGEFTFALSFPAIFFTPLDFFDELTTRDLTRDSTRAGAYLINILAFKGVLWLGLLAIVLIVLSLLGQSSQSVKAVMIVSLWLLVSIWNFLLRAMFRAFEQLSLPAMADIVEKGIVFIAGMAVLLTGQGYLLVLWIYVIAALSKWLILMIFIKRRIQLKFQLDLGLWKNLLNQGYPIAVGSFFAVMLLQGGVVLLSTIRGDQEVGWYGAAFRIYSVMMIVANSYTSSIYAILIRYVQKNRSLAIDFAKLSLKVLLAFSIPVTVGVMFLSRPISVVLFGKDYVQTSRALAILFLALPFYFIRNTLSIILFAVDKQKLITTFLAISAILSLTLGWALMPLLGLIGTSLSLVVAEALLVTGLFVTIGRHFAQLNLKGSALKPLLGSFAMSVFILLFPSLPLGIVIALGAAIYGLSMLVMKAFSRADLAILRKI